MTHAAFNYIDGPRIYRPAPRWMIVKAVVADDQKTTKGLLLPQGGKQKAEGSEERVPTFGEVVVRPRANGEEWVGYEDRYGGPLCDVGDIVIYATSLFPIVPLHDEMFLVSLDSVLLVIRKEGGDKADWPYEMAWVPKEDPKEIAK